MFVLSLFPGIGLLDMAFEQEGFCVVRGPDVLWGGDMRKFFAPAGKFDGIIGGPPCQSFSSLVHLVRANGHEPKFGNLIPEFERCVADAQPDWFVMENVPAAPKPTVSGYGTKSFLLDNSHLLGEDGMGLEQRRLRRFSFGMRGREDAQVPSLMRWIDLCVFTLQDAGPMLTQWTPNNSKEAKRRRTAVNTGHDDPNLSLSLTRARRVRKKNVSSSAGGRADDGTLKNARRYRFPEACRLQGLPEDFLSDSPFTAEGKLKAVANGVPIPMGRAIARAVKEALMKAQTEKEST